MLKQLRNLFYAILFRPGSKCYRLSTPIIYDTKLVKLTDMQKQEVSQRQLDIEEYANQHGLEIKQIMCCLEFEIKQSCTKSNFIRIGEIEVEKTLITKTYIGAVIMAKRLLKQELREHQDKIQELKNQGYTPINLM